MAYERGFAATGMCVLAVVGCGSGAMSLSMPDAGMALPDATGNVLTITLFNSTPFVDGDTENASLVAVQDGGGPWTAVEGDHGVYQVPLASTRRVLD